MRKYNLGRVFIGLIFIAVGIGYVGEQLHWWNFTIFFPGWWSLFLLIPTIYNIYDYGFSFTNVCIGCLGVFFLLQANDLITFRLTFPIIMAVCCICIGLKLMFTRRIKWYEYKTNEFKD